MPAFFQLIIYYCLNNFVFPIRMRELEIDKFDLEDLKKLNLADNGLPGQKIYDLEKSERHDYELILRILLFTITIYLLLGELWMIGSRFKIFGLEALKAIDDFSRRLISIFTHFLIIFAMRLGSDENLLESSFW